MKISVSTKGQILLPAEIRRQDDVEPGQVFDVERIERGTYRLIRRTPGPREGVVDWLLQRADSGDGDAGRAVRSFLDAWNQRRDARPAFPANPYCWMLWAEWFKVQGRRNAHEATLREMLRLFPNDLPARVELARLLIPRGEIHWDEAEHHLRNAMDRDPGDGHSRVVMAPLLALRGRGAEAEAMLAEFLRRYPDDATARESLDRLRAHAYPDTAAAAFDEAGDDGIQEGIDHDVPPIPPPGALGELLRRGNLAGEFSRARIAMAQGLAAPTTDLIRQESRKGDPLAGFYSQWLMPEETPEYPPHAWAWQACRYWQKSADTDDWQGLATQFPEAAPETEFLRVLSATPDDDNQSGAVGWHEHYCSGNNGASRPVDAFMREARKQLVGANSRERNELACTVMACVAADALDVVRELAA